MESRWQLNLMTKAFIAILFGMVIGLLVPFAVHAQDDSEEGDIPAALQIFPKELLDLRDPFKRPEVASEESGPRSELELIAIKDFELVGVMTGPSDIRAILKGPNNKTYIVTENVKIGLKRGVIKSITADVVKVEEMVKNALGQEEKKIAEIRFADKKK